MNDGLEEVFSWAAIYCSQFEHVLFEKDGIYKYEGEILDPIDPRLIAYLKAREGMKPIDLNW